jgi:hypothetical protein
MIWIITLKCALLLTFLPFTHQQPSFNITLNANGPAQMVINGQAQTPFIYQIDTFDCSLSLYSYYQTNQAYSINAAYYIYITGITQPMSFNLTT